MAMRNTRKGGLIWLLTCAPLLWIFTVATNIVSLGTSKVQNVPPGYTRDNSDWWSFTRTYGAHAELIPQEGDQQDSNFKILGLKLNQETFRKATAKLGKATVVERGDASTGRSQICYSSLGKQSKTYLIFEKGEVNESFYLFRGGPDWKGSELCTASNLVTTNLSTASGLRLGQTVAQVRAILGKSGLVVDGKLMYSLEAEKITPAEDFEGLRKRNPQLSEDELHRNYDYYMRSVYVEARFASGKLFYLAISKSESY